MAAVTSTKGILLGAVGRFALTEGHVTALVAHGPRMRAVTVVGSGLARAAWTPGDKIQVLLPSRDVRTYTPMTWDGALGSMHLLGFVHGDGPGARWLRELRVGEACRFVGPQRSLHRDAARNAIVFGDETSLALAVALHRAAPARALTCVLEATVQDDTESIAASLGLTAVEVIERGPRDLHLGVVATRLAAQLAAQPDAELLMTGRAQSIQVVKARLRDLGARRPTAMKPYWSVGKTGLD